MPPTPSPFHCFSLPRASTLEGNPMCGSEGNLSLCPGLHPLWIWAPCGDISHPCSSWAGVNSPPGAPSHREFPEPQACCDPSPRDFIHWGDCNPPALQIQGRKEREHHPRVRTTTPFPPSGHHRVHISPQPSHHAQGAKCADPEAKRSPWHPREQEEAPTSPVTLSKTGQKPRNPKVLLLQWIFSPWVRVLYPGVTHSRSIKVCWSRMFSPKGASSGSQRFTAQQRP